MAEDDLLRRRGRFELASDLLAEYPGVVMKAFAGVVVTRCEHNYDRQVFDYAAVSPHFELVEDGELAPHYDVTYDEVADTVTWKKAEVAGA